ncbi:MAG: NAD(P)H-dependent oxidoreductase [Candidatus Omnitrophica bacterium]|nr:NAD(P)H-dependent oxidoreductase [Candidatus Omnitrophota bacterium]
MRKLLHIIATPRGSDSRTLRVSKVFIDTFKNRNQDYFIDEFNLFEKTLPDLTIKRIDGKYALLGGKEPDGNLKYAWKDIEKEIERFTSADIYLISSPMWNFSIPYPLKHYIDIIFQPKYLFRYAEKGAEGLLKDKKMIVITSRGGDYNENNPAHTYDFQEPYLRAVFGFAGIKDIVFVNAQPMDAGGEALRNMALISAEEKARTLATEI